MPRDRDALPSLPWLPWHVALELAPEWGAPSLRLLVSRTNRMVTALRSMSTGFIRDPGGVFSVEQDCTWARARHQQRDLCRRLASFWKAWIPDLESAPASAEAVRLLLGTTLSGYGGGEVDPLLQGKVDSGGRPLLPKGAVCEIDVEEISLPEPGTIMVPLVDICPEAAYYFKTMDDTMLIAPAHLDRAALKAQKVYRDPALQDLQPRLRLCERLWLANMIGFTDRCEETLALFGVIKKYTDVEGASPTRSIRPVWDERRCNLRWEAPPFVPLGSPASFGHLDLSGLGPGDIVVSGTGDIPDMFSRLSLPPQAWPWFVLDVDLEVFRDYMLEKGHDFVVPPGARYAAVLALVMGWSWAPFLAHMALTAVIDGEFGEPAAASRLVYGHPTPQLRSSLRPNAMDMLHWAYIDDFGSIATTQSVSTTTTTTTAELFDKVKGWRSRMKRALGRVFLPVHKETLGEGFEALGATLGSRPYCVAAARRKIVLLVIATEALVNEPMTANTLEKIVGLWGWALVFCRPAYSVLNAVYHEIREKADAPAFRLSEDSRCELLTLAALALLLQTNLETPWALTAFATDSSDSGYGVCETRASLEEITAEGSYCEMRGWRVSL